MNAVPYILQSQAKVVRVNGDRQISFNQLGIIPKNSLRFTDVKLIHKPSVMSWIFFQLRDCYDTVP